MLSSSLVETRARFCSHVSPTNSEIIRLFWGGAGSVAKQHMGVKFPKGIALMPSSRLTAHSVPSLLSWIVPGGVSSGLKQYRSEISLPCALTSWYKVFQFYFVGFAVFQTVQQETTVYVGRRGEEEALYQCTLLTVKRESCT